MKKLSLLILMIMCLISMSEYADSTKISGRSRDQLIKDFTIVAQNYGALKFAYYTFTLEFERPPENIHELIETGHFMVEIVNPYTKGDVYLGEIGEKAQPAGLYYKKTGDTWGGFECFYINPNKPGVLRSLKTEIIAYTHEALHNMIFEDGASREEQLTRVYLLQLNDAIDSYYQKNGHIPDSLSQMNEKGDVNVSYLNPFTDEPVKNSPELSPGDYMYRKFTKKVKSTERKRDKSGKITQADVLVDKEFYEVVGWGEKLPVYYYSNDESLENFAWDEDNTTGNLKTLKNRADKDNA